MDREFHPPVLQEAVVNVPEASDSDERGTYAGDMDGFAENDLHNALDDMADGTIASGTVYSDVEGHRQNPELKMVMALMEMIDRPGERTSDATCLLTQYQHSLVPMLFQGIGVRQRALV